ncbi:MAG: hypothetical protein ABFS21_02675, partial [Actinomycetota bacterium]
RRIPHGAMTIVACVLVLGACSNGETSASHTDSTTAPTTTVATTTTEAAATTTEASTTSEPTTTTAMALPEPNDRTVLMPAGEAPAIDGIIEVGEWDNAATVTMSNDDLLHWMRSDGTLYVALDSGDVGAVNVVIARAGELWILHSSAALGSSLWVTSDSGWEQSHGYSWCCRSSTDDAARLGLLENEGWQANIGFTGDDGVVEYQIEIPWAGAHVAVVLHTEDNDPAYWPTDLPDEARDVITENRWSDPTLDVEDWWLILPAS